MKIKIECTVEVDPKVIRQLMQKMWVFSDQPVSAQSVRDLVKSHVIDGGVGTLSDALSSAQLPNAVDVIKTNI